jgi:hypothetical protein
MDSSTEDPDDGDADRTSTDSGGAGGDRIDSDRTGGDRIDSDRTGDDRADSERTTDANGDAETGGRGREVEVPLRVYKAVTVFSTLFAVAFVVGGFIVLDTATQRAQLALSEMNLPLAILGVAMIAVGAVVYAFATRFRAEGMGKPKERSDEQPDNG